MCIYLQFTSSSPILLSFIFENNLFFLFSFLLSLIFDVNSQFDNKLPTNNLLI